MHVSNATQKRVGGVYNYSESSELPPPYSTAKGMERGSAQFGFWPFKVMGQYEPRRATLL